MLPRARDIPLGLYRAERCYRLSSGGAWTEAWYLAKAETGERVGPAFASKQKLTDWMRSARDKD